ncbi:MAG: hypothetical protein EBU22_04060, partial [Actinobacteria bacterium]|nr:hypothetical protein [Actinomycetota bacterium]
MSKLDKYFYQFARIRNEENIVSGYLLTAQSPKINLVCDFLSTPPTYGDFSSFLLAVRLLSARSEVSFIMVVNELRSDWQELDSITKDDVTKAWPAWQLGCSALKAKPLWQSVCNEADKLN